MEIYVSKIIFKSLKLILGIKQHQVEVETTWRKVKICISGIYYMFLSKNIRDQWERREE